MSIITLNINSINTLKDSFALMYICLTKECRIMWGKNLIKLKAEKNKSTAIVKHSSTSLSEMHRSSRQKIRKDIAGLTKPLINWI